MKNPIKKSDSINLVASLFFGHFVLKFWTFRFGDYILHKIKTLP